MNGVSVISDTNALIYLLNGSQKAAEYLDLPLLTFDSDFVRIPLQHQK
ncbi:hypothetical protein GM418_23725 [Maribellus comscasis]|uniref:PIN domain-containing protein n=1 Tax=Maribellus comscasis TaxID=2681766 RepID=A0A6I6JYZ3_9BACT|nr:hypothetical protein [Maribellus comscasis]QGY46559.1 hypothetical protein GM418_23725 [Maribellus comscasis]